jgi:hypothetical protein
MMVAQFTDLWATKPGLISVKAICPKCEKAATVENLDLERFQRWMAGEMIQSAFPDLSAADRETLMSGLHDECFNAWFPPEDE